MTRNLTRETIKAIKFNVGQMVWINGKMKGLLMRADDGDYKVVSMDSEVETFSILDVTGIDHDLMGTLVIYV